MPDPRLNRRASRLRRSINGRYRRSSRLAESAPSSRPPRRTPLLHVRGATVPLGAPAPIGGANLRVDLLVDLLLVLGERDGGKRAQRRRVAGAWSRAAPGRPRLRQARRWCALHQHRGGADRRRNQKRALHSVRHSSHHPIGQRYTRPQSDSPAWCERFDEPCCGGFRELGQTRGCRRHCPSRPAANGGCKEKAPWYEPRRSQSPRTSPQPLRSEAPVLPSFGRNCCSG